MSLLPLFLLPFLTLTVQGANILVFLPLATWSHYMQYEHLYETLASRGHHITLYSPFPPQQNLSNFKHVYMNSQAFDSIMKEFDPFKDFNDMDWFLQDAFTLFTFSQIINEDLLTHQTFLDLIKSKQSFDLVMIEPFFCQESTIILGHTFKAPVIHMGATGPHAGLLEAMGSPHEASFMPELYSYLSDEMTFLQRVTNLHYATIRYVFRRICEWTKDRLIADKLGPGFPSLGTLIRNISLCFLYSTPGLEYAQPLSANMVQVGGIHIQRNKTVALPKDLKETLDAATNGFILFSLGSVISPTTMPPSLGRTFMDAFSRMSKYKILWKWSGEPLVGLPSNVIQLKWIPQMSVLAHPNCKLFITHGGLSSQLETIYHGVPVVTIPFFGDQFHSATKAERFGFGVTVRNTNLTSDSLVWAISEVLSNPSFKRNALERSVLMRDTPSPINTAVFWTEYILKHKGAHHLSSVFRDLYWFQYYLLDILLTAVTVLAGIVFIVRKIVRTVLYRYSRFLRDEKRIKSKRK